MLFSKFPKTGLINFQILLSILLDHSWFKRMGGPFRGIERKLSESTEITNFLFLFWASMFSLWNSQIFRTAQIGNEQLEKNRRNAISWQSNVTNYHFSDKGSLNKSSISIEKVEYFLYSLFCVLRALRKLMRRPVLHINLNRKQFNKSSQTDAQLPHSQQKLTLVSKTTFHFLAPPETLLLTIHPNCETTLTH